MFVVIIECDPSGSLGVSCLNDIHNLSVYFRPIAKEIHVYTTKRYEHREVFTDIKYHILSGDLEADTKSVLGNRDLKRLVVALTGHGMQIHDDSGDEPDGLDEYIVLSSRRTIYRDDNLNRIFLQRNDYQFIGITDTCHSGTMFDLPYTNDNGRITFNKKHHDIKCTDAFTISGCRDNEVSVCDAFGGSLTQFLLKDNRIDAFLRQDLTFMNDMIRDMKKYGQMPCIQMSIKNIR